MIFAADVTIGKQSYCCNWKNLILTRNISYDQKTYKYRSPHVHTISLCNPQNATHPSFSAHPFYEEESAWILWCIVFPYNWPQIFTLECKSQMTFAHTNTRHKQNDKISVCVAHNILIACYLVHFASGVFLPILLASHPKMHILETELNSITILHWRKVLTETRMQSGNRIQSYKWSAFISLFILNFSVHFLSINWFSSSMPWTRIVFSMPVARWQYLIFVIQSPSLRHITKWHCSTFSIHHSIEVQYEHECLWSRLLVDAIPNCSSFVVT